MIETGTPWRVRPCAEGYMIETARGRRVVRGSGGVRDREVAEHIARAVNGQTALVAAASGRRALAAGFAQDGAEVPSRCFNAWTCSKGVWRWPADARRGLVATVKARRRARNGGMTGGGGTMPRPYRGLRPISPSVGSAAAGWPWSWTIPT